MPISHYSVLKGHPTAGKVVSGASAHYQITLNTLDKAGQPFTVAVNIQSVDGSEVLYAIKPGFIPTDAVGLANLAPGITPLPSKPGGLALDFVREVIAGQPMITRAQMALLPTSEATPNFFAEERTLPIGAREEQAHALENAVVALLNQAVADAGSVLYAFGSAFADGGVMDGIHDIHMNQGNPLNNHGNDNGIWQDGAVFVNLPAQGTWTALFLAFQTQSWTTDPSGNPI